MEKKTKRILLGVIGLLLILTAIAAWFYLKDRPETPAHSLAVTIDGAEKTVDLYDLELSPLSGTVVNGKGEEKNISGKGILLSEVIGISDFTEALVTADDGYSAAVKADEMGSAWLWIEGSKARLIVFGDPDSKRDVKDVVRIEVK